MRFGTEPAPAEPVLDGLRQATASVAAGNYADAIAQLRRMGGAYEHVFTRWIEDAHARMAADVLIQGADEVSGRAQRPIPK